MGNYTAFHIDAKLKASTPKYVIDILKLLTVGPGEDFINFAATHEYVKKKSDQLASDFFQTSHYDCLFYMDSAYFVMDTEYFFEEHDGVWYLHGNSNLKNYDDEISKFCQFIHPYIDLPDGDNRFAYELYETGQYGVVYMVDQDGKFLKENISIPCNEETQYWMASDFECHFDDEWEDLRQKVYKDQEWYAKKEEAGEVNVYKD